MRYPHTFILLFLMFIVATSNAQEATKKLIDYSAFNVPTPQILLDNIPAMQSRGFAGSIFKLEGISADIFVNTPHDEAALNANYPVLKQLKDSGYTENFLQIYSQMNEGWSWFSDSDWGHTEAKLTAFVKAAKEGGLTGFMFDAEPYGYSPWRYDEAYYQGKTLEEVSQVVRERGKRFMDIIQGELPDAKILSLWLMHPIVAGWDNYTMFKPFFEGMLEAALPSVQFIDGNEMSYYFLKAEDFDWGAQEVYNRGSVIDPNLADKYQAQVKVGNAVFVDGLLNLWRSPRFIGYYFANDAERLSLIQHNTYHALRTADEYVWIYAENINYFTNEIPDGLADNLKAGLDKFSSGQPLDISVEESVTTARLEFDRRIELHGKITTKTPNAGATVSSGYTTESGQESACNVHNAYGDFACTFPYGTTVTLRPVLEGAEFTPSEITLTNLTEAPASQDFTEQ